MDQGLIGFLSYLSDICLTNFRFSGFGGPMPFGPMPFGGIPGPGFVEKPTSIFGSDTYKPAKPFTGTPQPLFGADSIAKAFGTPKPVSGTPQPLFGPDSPYGKRPTSGSDSGSKRVKKSRFEPIDVVKPKKEVVFCRDMSYGTQNCDPNAPPIEVKYYSTRPAFKYSNHLNTGLVPCCERVIAHDVIEIHSA